jgi:glycine/D-amino acid oxidase-like deaminating enzyme
MVATRFVSETAGLSPLMPTVQCMELGLWLRELHGAFSWGGGFAYRLLSALREDGLEFGYGRPVSSVLIDAQYAHQDKIAEVFPALSRLSTAEAIQGVPVYTVDGGLYVGAVPGIEGLWAVAGDNESGITHGPGMGKLVAQLIMDETPFTDPTPFRLDRVDPAAYPDEASMVAAMVEDRIAKVAKLG